MLYTAVYLNDWKLDQLIDEIELNETDQRDYYDYDICET